VGPRQLSNARGASRAAWGWGPTRIKYDSHVSVLSEQEFRVRADEALEALRRSLLPLADREGFEVELQNGVLNVVFEEPVESKFVISPNAPVRQIWVSARSRSFKLAWAPDATAFALDGETLPALVERLVQQQLSVE
jgi:frataxin